MNEKPRNLDDVITESQSIKIIPLNTANVIVFPSGVKQGDWIIKCNVEAVDVDAEDGRTGHFATEWVGEKPTWREVLDTVVAQFRHEVMEQLKLDPHELRKVDNARKPST